MIIPNKYIGNVPMIIGSLYKISNDTPKLNDETDSVASLEPLYKDFVRNEDANDLIYKIEFLA